MNGDDLTGFNSHFMNMVYIASLGFAVVPGWYRGFNYSFTREGVLIEQAKKKKLIKFTEIFK